MKSAKKEKEKLKKEVQSVLDKFNKKNKNFAFAKICLTTKWNWDIFLMYDEDSFIK